MQSVYRDTSTLTFQVIPASRMVENPMEDDRRRLRESRLLCDHILCQSALSLTSAWLTFLYRRYSLKTGSLWSRSLLWRTGEGPSRLSSPNTIVVLSTGQFNAGSDTHTRSAINCLIKAGGASLSLPRLSPQSLSSTSQPTWT